jgi:4-amino-4-deoxy-L-arabinose transferase-like glycosyltransferase
MKAIWKNVYLKYVENKDRYFFILIILLAVFLLFCRIGSRTLWMDETAVLDYYYQTPNPINFLIEYFRMPDNHPPLYYFLVILAYNILPLGELGIRLVSVLAGLGIVVTVYYFSLLFFEDKKTARLAMFLTALSSYFVLISQMARYHSLAAFFSLLFLYFFSKIILRGYAKKDYIYFIISGVAACFTDYPHFIYIVAITNVYFFYKYIVKKEKILSLARWILSQLILLAAFAPMVWLLYLRIARQGDGGFEKASLLGRSLANWVSDFFIHFYAFFFGENILPWNWLVFGLGSVALLVLTGSLIKMIYKRQCPKLICLLLYYFFAAIILNTLFLNYANPRYNFIVYPKFVFVAFPLFAMILSYLILRLRSKGVRWFAVGAIILVEIIGLVHFYSPRNYLNGSYFNSFRSFEFVRDNSIIGDKLIINGDANAGVYNFYKYRYFSNLIPIKLDEATGTIKKDERAWFFSTGSDDGGVNNEPAGKMPPGFKVVSQYESVPLDPTLKYWKEKILHRASYTHKYGVYLIVKE